MNEAAKYAIIDSAVFSHSAPQKKVLIIIILSKLVPLRTQRIRSQILCRILRLLSVAALV